jgi:aldehyde dehydrogenase (NAD+)
VVIEVSPSKFARKKKFGRQNCALGIKKYQLYIEDLDMPNQTDELKSWALDWLKSPKQHYIGGKWVSDPKGLIFESKNPADGTPLTSYTMATKEMVDRAVKVAGQAHEAKLWLKTSMRERAQTLRKIGELIRDHFDELAHLETLPNGKLLRESYEDDLPDCADIFDYYSGWIGKQYGDCVPVEDGFLNYTMNQPHGVCGLISPWNFPLLLACWKLAPALATGNCVVMKPSEYTPYTLIRLIELIDQNLDLPKGLINLVLGDGKVGQMMTEHQGIHKISFTGSTAVGKEIVINSGASNLKAVTLELGGKSPNIIFADVPDLEAALERSYQVMFSQKGEKCSEPTRWFIHRDHYETAISWLSAKAEAVKCGDPYDPKSDQGSQCNRPQFEKIMRYIEYGKEDGARLIAGGTRDTSGNNEQGYFVRPTIFADCHGKMRIATDEIFGPILSLFPFEEDSEAIIGANDTTFGLAAGLWTSDVSRAHRVAAELDAGMIFINRYGMYDFTSPFGGFRQSGWGKEMAHQSLAAFTKTKSVWLKL